MIDMLRYNMHVLDCWTFGMHLYSAIFMDTYRSVYSWESVSEMQPVEEAVFTIMANGHADMKAAEEKLCLAHGLPASVGMLAADIT